MDKIGVESAFFGNDVLITCRKTAKARRTVIDNEILSPLSGGRKKLNNIMIINTTHGAMTLNTKYKGRRLNVKVNVTSWNGSGQQIYFTVLFCLRSPIMSHSDDTTYFSDTKSLLSISSRSFVTSNAHDPNCNLQTWLSKGKNLTFILHVLVNVAGANHLWWKWYDIS